MVSNKHKKHFDGDLVEMLREKLSELNRENLLEDLATALQDTSILKKKYLTVEEVAEVLRISQGTFRSWVSRGMVPFPIIKLGKRILVDEDDLKDHLNSAKRVPSKVNLKVSE